MLDYVNIITRNSVLAICQTQILVDKLKILYPDLNINIDKIVTKGDKILNKPLNLIGGKGLFTKELEQLLLTQKSDMAVHSAKDLPSFLSNDFTISAYLKREDPSDCFISNKYLDINDMPIGSIIGTSSIRRRSFLNKYFPKLKVVSLRGNVITRLKKLDDGSYDGIILATAGLNRLGLYKRIMHKLPIDIFIPSIGQGALAIETLKTRVDLQTLLTPLNDQETYIEVETERKVGYLLNAGCNSPISVYAKIKDNYIKLSAVVIDPISQSICKFIQISNIREIDKLIKNCIDDLNNQGAQEILRRST